jgi:tetratricopeptide (TPR) repeat protein
MPRKLAFYLLTFALVWPAAVRSASAQAPGQAAPQAKTAEEANLFNSILKETDAKRKLAVLDEWKQKYPDTDFKQQRLTFYIQAYQATGQLAKAVEAAQEMLKLQPDNLNAHFTIASLVPLLGSQDPNVWAEGDKAANYLLQNADQLFAPDKKPQGVDDAAWNQAKQAAITTAHQTLGWVAKAQKKNEVAEQELIKALQMNPTLAQVSFWLGETVLAEKNPDKYPLALFSFARAAAYTGQGALTPAGRQQVDAFLTKIYRTYHGDASGLDDLKKMAMSQPLPPADLKIKSHAEVAAEKEEELKKSNPKLAMAMGIKEGLTGAEAANYWNEMKGKALPGLQGKVVSAKPAVKPKVVELDLTNSGSADVTLAAPETPARCKLDPGATVEFEGAEAKAYTGNPFMLKLEGGKITSGCSEAPAPVKKAPAKKAGAAKKKAG